MTAAALLCVGEALNFCPGGLQAKDQGLACLRTKLRMLSAPCRDVYDQGLSFLCGGDVHFGLRGLRGQGTARPKVDGAAPAR